MSMDKAYNHREVEQKLYEWWERNQYFRPETQARLGQSDPSKPPYVIAMPPPNVTGALHLGHAITNSVEDLLIRYNRMLGHPTLWIPGTDHAGIATQNVVERKLDEQGITRNDLGRERFVREVWDWKDEYHGRITTQQKSMGISCDWHRERFTLDDGLSDAVLEAFVQLYNEGLIYRGNYLVNWCPRCQSAISDLEVEYEEVDGTLYTFRYPLRDGGFVEVSTTRPETILGDTALAVHPDDDRYRKLVGKSALVPMLNREIPIIADEHVDPDFGTGALKVTPGHDPNDYEIGRRHQLPMINIMNPDATLNEEAGPYVGLDRYAARARLWEDMKTHGLVMREQKHTHQVGHCQRCNTVVEPLLSEQWWVKVKPLAEQAIEAVRSGKIQIVPERFDKIYYNWMENIRDWCISRQLWWGHRIPIWYGPDGTTFAAHSESEAHEKAIEHYGESVHLEQDPDVLDTWFSSGLWPFSTLGWPEQTQDLDEYYPTTVLETGYDIIFFWVARMIMFGLKFTGEIPFKYVYLHGMFRDEQGRKMSKSLGNALDPLELSHEYGTDALRFTLLTGSTPGNDMKLSTQRIEGSRNFANKIWNAARFVIMNLEQAELPLDDTSDPFDKSYRMPDQQDLSLADKWILSRIDALTDNVTRLINTWQLGEAGRQIYEFLWNEYCDWYIEAAKVRLYNGSSEEAQATRQVLANVLERSLRLLHPFMPFVTEAIWQNLPNIGTDQRALIISRWPSNRNEHNTAVEEQFDRIQSVVRAIRNARSEFGVDPSRQITAVLSVGDHVDLFTTNSKVVTALAKLDFDRVQIGDELEAPQQSATLSSGGVAIYLPLAGMLDLEVERTKLQKEIDDVAALIQRSHKLLTNAGFVSKAPDNVVQRERDKIEELETKHDQLKDRLAQL